MRIITALLVACLISCFVGYAQIPADFRNFTMANTPSVFTTNNFKTIAVDRFGAVWAGSQYGGLYTFVTSSNTWIKSTTLTNVFINDIKADPKGGIWVAQSGTQGATATEGNRQGAVSYFSDETYATIADYGVDAIGNGGLNSRNVRAIWIDTATANKGELGLPRVFATQGGFLTNGNTKAGGIAIGTNPPGSWLFGKINKGLQIFPNTNIQSTGTPFCEAVGGNRHEMWVSVRTNYGGSEILRYDPKTGAFLGGYDSLGAFSNKRRYYKDLKPAYTSAETLGKLRPGFRVAAIHFDGENRKWVGMQAGFGGLVVVEGSVWTKLNLSAFLADGFGVNNNAITEDEEGNVFIGTTAGLLMYKAGENPTNSNSYQLITINNGLPSNNITGLCADVKNQRILIATDAGLSFWSRRKPVAVTLGWDYSFPLLDTKPRGVCADGISRVYLKIKRASEALPAIKNVEVFIKNYVASEANIRGTLKKAITLDRYTEEASTGTLRETSRTDSTPAGEFIFWYVAPEDFANGTLDANANEAERRDSIKIRITYATGVKDSSTYAMRISRPPLLLVHGLASGPGTWDPFTPDGDAPYITNPKFKYCKALTMDGKGLFKDNATRLLAGDGTDQDAKDNSLQGNLEEMHIRGFAANQVDYVCHSMGGIMMRQAYGMYPDKFKANGNYRYNNYGKGFVHKFITVNTPHNSSPVADLVYDFAPKFNEYQRGLFTYLYKMDPKLQQPFDFIQPDPATVGQNEVPYNFMPSDAVTNLQVRDRTGGVNLPQTNLKHHMIAGDVNLTAATLSGLENYTIMGKIVSLMMEQYRHEYTADRVGVDLYFDENVTELQRMIYFFNLYSAKLDYPAFTQDGDLIVPLGSQLAREVQNQPHIKVFNNLADNPVSSNHVAMLPRVDVGAYVFGLLNETVNNNPHFADVIPANTDREPPGLLGAPPLAGKSPTQNEVAIGVSYDTAKVKITSPLTGGAGFADSTLAIQFRLKDTVGLAFIKIDFQDSSAYRRRRDATQQILMKVKPAYTGPQTIYVAAVYDKPNGVEYHIDTISLSINNKDTLQDFRIADDEASIVQGTPYLPAYEVKYKGQWVPLLNGIADVQVVFDSANVVAYNAVQKNYTGLKAGTSIATVTYNGFEDDIVLNVLPAKAVENCVNNTIAAGSFKNPAIWSKGVVPSNCDSVTIAHAVTLDSSMQFGSMRINAGAALTLSGVGIVAQVGTNADGNKMIDNYGTLNISNGSLTVMGRVKLNAGSTFTMTGGTLKIDGNTGVASTSVADGLALFEAAAGMAAFTFTGGTLQMIDPPLGATGHTISSAYNFGANSTLVLGDGISTQSSNNASGFGGTLFPATIGKLVVDAVVRTGNRQFITKKALTVKASLQVKPGSGVVQEASLRVGQ